MQPTEEQTYREGVLHKLDELKTGISDLDKKVSFTNGKVRKIIVALVLVFGILIGQNFSTAHDIIGLLFSGLHP